MWPKNKLRSQEISKRELAGDLGISPERVNYCFQALIAKGLVKASNFRKSKKTGRCQPANAGRSRGKSEGYPAATQDQDCKT